MKNLLIFVAFFSLGFALGGWKPKAVQSTDLLCVTGNECGQYILQINSQRGFGRFVLYQVSGTAIDTSNYANVAGGNPSFTYQAAEPAPRADYTFTVTASEP